MLVFGDFVTTQRDRGVSLCRHTLLPPTPLFWPGLGTLWRWEGAKREKKKKAMGKKKKWTICCFRCAANPLIEPLMLFKLATGAKLLMKF